MKPPQSLTLCAHPKKNQIFGNYLTLPVDLLTLCTTANFHPRLPPNLTEVQGDPARSLGPVGCGSWSLDSESLAGWAGCTLSKHLALWNLDGDVRRLLLAQQGALDAQKDSAITLPKVLLWFWKQALWQQAHTALLEYPENILWMFSIQENKN